MVVSTRIIDAKTDSLRNASVNYVPIVPDMYCISTFPTWGKIYLVNRCDSLKLVYALQLMF